MARSEIDREDLMREATAYKRRCLVSLVGCEERLFVGFRDSGALSLYFDDDPVYQFDLDGRLRRAFVDGKPLRSERDTLAQLTRQRSERSSQLLRHDLSAAELCRFRVELVKRLQSVSDTLERGDWELLESIPDADVIDALPVAIERSLRLLGGYPEQPTRWLSAPLK